MTDDAKPRTQKDSHYARLRRAHRDAARGGEPPERRPQPAHPGRPVPPDRVHLYGLHTVSAALANPERRLHRLLVTKNALQRLGPGALPCPHEIADPRQLDAELGSDAVHQGVLLEADPLRQRSLDELGDADLVLVLDQVTDPHNVGAILRSAAAFSAGALVTTARHSPQESGVLAKAASGALELVPHLQVANLAAALEELGRRGFQTIGLDAGGEAPLEEVLSGGRIALVLGAEGKGLRQKTRETVSALARLEMSGPVGSLNVSNAAAIALYAARRRAAGVP